MGQPDEEHKGLLFRVVQAARQRLGWWRLTQSADESCHFGGGFASGSTVDLCGGSLWECLKRVDDLMSEAPE